MPRVQGLHQWPCDEGAVGDSEGPREHKRDFGASNRVDEEGPIGPCCGLPMALINPGSVPDDNWGDHKEDVGKIILAYSSGQPTPQGGE